MEVQLAFVDKHRKALQSVHVVSVGEIGILAFTLPCLDHNTTHCGRSTQIDHESWSFRVVVVHNGAFVQGVVFIAIDCESWMAFLQEVGERSRFQRVLVEPALAWLSLVGPNLFLKCQVFHLNLNNLIRSDLK